MREIVLVTVNGPDRPGITAAVTAILARSGVTVLDIGQAVIHDTLSLGLLVELPGEGDCSPVVKDLLFKVHGMGLQIRFTPVDADDYERWVGQQGRPRYIVTLLGRKVSAEHIARVSAAIAEQGLGIDDIVRLSGRVSLREEAPRPNACIELSVRGVPRDLQALRRTFMDICLELGLDIGLQEDSPYRRIRRLVAFDMDSTLIQAEVIDELARRAGVGDQVAAITEAAMRGELDFQQSFRRRLALLKGLDAAVLEDIARHLPITEGADRLLATLKALGYKIAILSGGFSYFGEHLQRRWGIDYVYSNTLEVVDGKVTGRVDGAIVDGPRKAELLREIAAKEGIRLEQTIAVGDGANDLPMLNTAGLGIAFHAKPIVKEGARHAISTLGLDGVLYFLGLRERETRSMLD